MSLAILRLKLRNKRIQFKHPITIPILCKTIEVKKNFKGDPELAELIRRQFGEAIYNN